MMTTKPATRPPPTKRTPLSDAGSLFKRQRNGVEPALSASADLKYIFHNGKELWMSVQQSMLPAGSLLAELVVDANPRTPIDLSDLPAVCEADVFYTLFSCLANSYDVTQGSGPQYLSTDDANKLRDACSALQLDFDTVVRPHFATHAEYERCVYTLAHPDATGQLSFINDRALLTFISMTEKYAGLFVYTYDNTSLRLRNVRQHASLRFAFDGNDLVMQLDSVSRRRQFCFVNRTPAALRLAPAPPSYYDNNVANDHGM